MTPNFNNKDIVLTHRFFRVLKKDDVVVIRDLELGIVIKRIKHIDKLHLNVASDNNTYNSPTNNKKYKLNQVIGKVLFKM